MPEEEKLQTPQEFLAEIEDIITNPARALVIHSAWFMSQIKDVHLKSFMEQRFGEPPSTAEHVWNQVRKGSSNFLSSLGSMVTGEVEHGIRVKKYWKVRRPVEEALCNLQCSRPSMTLTEQEKAYLRGMAQLYASGQVEQIEWLQTYAYITLNDGQCVVDPVEGFAVENNEHFNMATSMFFNIVSMHLMTHQSILKHVALVLAQHQDSNKITPEGARQVSDAAGGNSNFFSDADLPFSEKYVDAAKHPESLNLGWLSNGSKQLGFVDSTSLITIGGSGTGKSQRHIIPNLLTYPGSVIVLDPQGELWEDTAGYRQANFGDVYRFSPADQRGNTHCYNPFDFLPRDPMIAPTEALTMAKQLMPDNPELKDPHWHNKGRSLLWAYLTVIALTGSDTTRNFETLNSYLNTTNEEGLMNLIEGAYYLSKEHDMPAVYETLSSLADMKDSKREEYLGTAKEFTHEFSISPLLRKAIGGRSDWRPTDLRRKQGMSIYLSMPAEKISDWSGLLRVIINQHIAALANERRPQGELPITLFLDEMPRLGAFDPILTIQDIGRKAGLRLWMACQSYKQLEQAFGVRASSIVGGAAVKMFMRPTRDEIQFIEDYLGETENFWTGKIEPEIKRFQMMGAEHRNSIVAIAGGEKPAILNAPIAAETMGHMMYPPPRKFD
jgi:type IV secretion system protein VirD4